MGELTYPREWFRVSRWSKEPEPREFQRETAHRLFTGTRSYHKSTEYERWYTTREEAQAAIDARNAEAAEAARMKRIRDAAPELLAALVELRGFGCPVCNGDCSAANPPVNCCPMQSAEAAIRKARGQ